MSQNNLDFYAGNEAMKKSEHLKLEFPIENGLISDWDNMEKVWTQIFEKQLKIE